MLSASRGKRSVTVWRPSVCPSVQSAYSPSVTSRTDILVVFGSVGTGILISHVLLLGELISFLPSAHPTIPLMGRKTFSYMPITMSTIIIRLLFFTSDHYERWYIGEKWQKTASIKNICVLTMTTALSCYIILKIQDRDSVSKRRFDDTF